METTEITIGTELDKKNARLREREKPERNPLERERDRILSSGRGWL